jgi:putative phosphoesterase
MPSGSSGFSVGLISDTHGLLRPEALAALRGSRYIVHAGDIGDPAILEGLSPLAPVTAVRGNNDTASWARRLPDTAVLEAGSTRIYVLHDLKALDCDPVAEGFGVVVAGHSHKPGELRRDGVLFVNPGSAGPRRFKLPVTVARLRVSARTVSAEIVQLK